jgi:hypothetical protein
MANITLKDLEISNDSGSFVRDLSEDELDLQGGFLGIHINFKKLFKKVVGVVGVVKAVAGLLH